MKKKLIIFFMIISIALSLYMPSFADEVSSEEEKTLTISLIIEGYNNTLYNNSVEIRYSTEFLTLQNALKMIDAQTVDIEIKGISEGEISDINGEINGMFDGNEKWNVAVNGIVCDASLRYILLNDKDVVSLFFADAPFAYPLIDTSKARDGVLHFYSQRNLYDSSFSLIGSLTEDISGAVVTFEGKEYVTDDNGIIDLKRGLGNGEYSYSVNKEKSLSNNKIPAAMKITDGRFVIEDVKEFPNFAAYIFITALVFALIIFGVVILALNKNKKKKAL